MVNLLPTSPFLVLQTLARFKLSTKETKVHKKLISLFLFSIVPFVVILLPISPFLVLQALVTIKLSTKETKVHKKLIILFLFSIVPIVVNLLSTSLSSISQTSIIIVYFLIPEKIPLLLHQVKSLLNLQSYRNQIFHAPHPSRFEIRVQH